jgi:hypothetical protein
LNAAFNSEFIEGQTQTYILDDTTSGAFQLLMQWLYGKKVRLRALHSDYKEAEANLAREDTQSLVELWVLADKSSIPKLQNLVIKKIKKISDRVGRIYTQGFHYIYEHRAKDSPLRKFWVELTGLQLQADDFTEGEFPEEMLLELAIFHARRKSGPVDHKVILDKFFVEEESGSESSTG